ncbi:Non-specific serine/threonine protein kinase, partial [Bertholletia excelsa]
LLFSVNVISDSTARLSSKLEHCSYVTCFSFSYTAVVNLSREVPADSDCVLDFVSFPYEPAGECAARHQERINSWGGFPTTLCCRNALTVVSKALAWHANRSSQTPTGQAGNQDYIFLRQNEWRNCIANTFLANLSSNCSGFHNLFFDSTNACSDISLSSLLYDDDQTFKNATSSCAISKLKTSSFKKACSSCIDKVKNLMDNLVSQLGPKKNHTQRAICAVAAVTSIAAAQMTNESTSVDDFYRCLLGLDAYEPGYIKIKCKWGVLLVVASLGKILLAILLATVGMVLAVVLIKYVTKNNRKGETNNMGRSKQITTAWSGLYRFSKAEIVKAINQGGGGGSNERKCLGRGSAGQVFKGVLPSGQVVAIKQIYRSNTSDSFTREVQGLSRVRHPNLVALFGCCMEDGEQYLVYEFCSAGNLAQHLLRNDEVLTWGQRVKILRDCALALRYLHNNMDGRIVHRDIKLTNILLTEQSDGTLEAKLSDFGLARLLNMEESKVFTDVRGTIGYMDPEYMSNAKLTSASDIYSFGIVVLQLLSGQKVIELDLDARDQLTRKAKDVSLGKRPLSDFEDPRLNGKVDIADFESILQIAVLCVARSSKGRPDIDTVFKEINKAYDNTPTTTVSPLPFLN